MNAEDEMLKTDWQQSSVLSRYILAGVLTIKVVKTRII